jgi:hypothetical protein
VQLALRQRLRDSEFLAAGAVALAFIILLIGSWHRWLSPLTDSGREMDLPYRLLHGELLYRDINYLYGPLSPYFNALLYWLFGSTLGALQLSGIAGALLVILLSFRIARRVLEPRESALAVLAIMVWLVFRPQGNLISPYAYAALHASVFSLTALLASLRYRESGRLSSLLLAGTMSGLAAVSKLEFALPALAATCLSIYLTRDSGRSLAKLFAVIAPFIFMTLSVYGWFLYKVGWETLVVDCHVFYTHLPRSLITYNAWRAGTNRPLASILEILGGLAVFIVAASLIVLLASLAGWFQHRAEPVRRIALKALGIGIVAAIAALAISRITALLDGGGWDGSPLRAAPVILLALIWFARRDAVPNRERPAILIIATFSLVMLVRVALRVPSGGPYGAFLLPTTYVLIVYVLARATPEWIRRQNELIRAARLIALSLLAAAITIGAVVTVIRYRTRFIYEVNAVRGHFRVVSNHHPAIQEALDFLRENSSVRDRIAIFPEGSDIAFLSDRLTPLRHQILLPGLVSRTDESRMAEQLASTPIRFVFVVNRATGEFGPAVFGKDYYHELGSAIERDYHLVKVCGKRPDPDIEIGDREFFIKILERR